MHTNIKTVTFLLETVNEIQILQLCTLALNKFLLGTSKSQKYTLHPLLFLFTVLSTLDFSRRLSLLHTTQLQVCN